MEKTLEKIHRSTLTFLEPLRIQETYSRIVKEAVKLVNGKDGLIIIKQENDYQVVYASTPNMTNFVPRKRGFVYQAFKKQRAFVIYPKDFGKLYPHMVKQGIRSGIYLPLSYKKKSFGVLIIRSHKNQKFTKKELSILELFGSLASLAIRKTYLYDDAKENSILKDKFISLAAHELRTPLTSMSGYIQLLHKRMQKSPGSEFEWVKTLLQESNRLGVLIEEIIDINKINAGKLQLYYQECRLDEIVLEAIQMLELTYPKHPVHLTSKVAEAPIIGDKAKLTKVIYNVLENAAKFSHNSQKITLTFTSDERYFIIRIQDKGFGIEKKDMRKIFNIFYKAHNEEKEGMGFGLFFARNVIQEHKGRIKINSEYKKGTLVEIKLPQIKHGRS